MEVVPPTEEKEDGEWVVELPSEGKEEEVPVEVDEELESVLLVVA